VKLKGKIGYIDKNGVIAIPAQYEYGNDFSEGLCAVKFNEGLAGYPQWGFVDVSGRMVIKPQYDHVSDFVDGMALVSTRERGVGYIDKSGHYVWGTFHR
jgi:hypothetical protein